MKMPLFLKFFLLGELFLFGYGYFFGAYGMCEAKLIQRKTEEISKKLIEVKNKIAMIELEIEEWKRNSFFKEQVARERLGMAGRDDIVYYID